MTSYAVLVKRTTDGSPIYFAKTDTERYDEPNMKFFDTLAEVKQFVAGVRSGYRYTDAGGFVGPVTRNHLSVTLYQVRYGTVGWPETYRLDSLPDWMLD